MAVDALLRCHSTHPIMVVSSCQPKWVTKVKLGYEDDSEAIKLLELWKKTRQLPQEYTVQDGLIKHKGRVWLGSNKLAHQHIIQAFHDTGVRGRSGFLGSY